MVMLQERDSKKNESEVCNWHKHDAQVNGDEDDSNRVMLDSLTLPTSQDNINDSAVRRSSENNGDIDIVEIIENDDNDGDEDEMEYEEEKDICDTVEWMQKIQHETSDGQVLPIQDNPTFGEVCVTNSTNVRVGNTTLYKGPVTIKQFVYTNSNPVNESDASIVNSQKCDNNLNHVSNVIKEDVNTSQAYPEYNKVKEWLWTWRCAAILCILGLILITILVVLTVMLTQHSEFLNFSPAIDPDDILTDNVRFIQRVEWGAQPPEDPLKKLTITPVPYVIISHTASEACYNQADCIQRVRLAQTMHIEGNKWSDIGYNFLVGGDGLIYVGRGWNKEGAHAFGFNSKSIGISLIGTFNQMVPPTRQLHALAELIAIGVKKDKIRKDYKLLGHRQVAETLSPGNVLYGIIKNWDHWSEKP